MPWIQNCINSVLNSDYKSDILVIDNNSIDGTQKYIRDKYPNIRFIQNLDNKGFGAANNIGLRIALQENYDYVYLLNQDAYLFNDTLSKLISVANDNPQIGILSPIQVDKNGNFDINFEKKCGKYLKDDISEVPFVMAAHWLISNKAIQKVGGFSPSFNQYGEDDNYIDRLHYHSMTCVVVQDVKAIHDRAPRDKTKRMQLKNIAVIVKVSNPNTNYIIRAFLELVAMSIKNLSLTPLKFIPKLIKRFPELRHNRKISKELGAFL